MKHERIEIKLSKQKGLFTFLGAVAFVAASIWLITYAYTQPRYDPVLVTVIGYAGVVFFGLSGLYILYKLFGTKPGLIIDSDGIYDNSSAAAGHLIKWERIKGIRIEQIMSTKFILIDIEDPEEFINSASGIRKRLMSGTYNMYGTPASISSSALRCNLDELFQILNERLQQKIQTKT